jgi:hypothetical protein
MTLPIGRVGSFAIIDKIELCRRSSKVIESLVSNLKRVNVPR